MNRPVIEPDDNSHDIDPLMREAIAWVVRLRSGEATEADLAAVRKWRAQSSDHENALRQAAVLWRDLKVTADRISESNRQTSMFRSLHPARWTPTRRAFVGGAIAASAAAYLVYNPPMQLWPSLGELSADFRTGKGERREVTLASGVSATLSTQTSIASLGPEGDEPRFQLISGEAVISAKRAVSQPLIMQALDARIVATRASFNARCLDGKVSVTCLDGQLDIESGRDLVQLRPGQQIVFSSGNGLGAAVPVDPADAVAWKNNLLIVRDRPLAEVVEEVNRYRHGRIIVTSASLGRRLVNGTFHIERLESFPSQVRELFGAGVRALPGGVVLLS